MIHKLEQHGPEAAGREYRQKVPSRHRSPDRSEPRFVDVLLGKLQYLKMVKGENDHVYRNLHLRLHRTAPNLIKPLVDDIDEYKRVDAQWESLYRKYEHSVFQLETTTEKGDLTSGTSFAYSRRSLATAAHNLERPASVYLESGEKRGISDYSSHPQYQAGIDVAVVQPPRGILGSQRRIPSRTESLVPGEQIAVIGYASVPQRQSGLGIYSGTVISQLPTFNKEVETIQMHLQLPGGLSGGPVIDRGGRRVGVASEVTFNQTLDGDEPQPLIAHAMPVQYLLELEPP